MRTFTISLALAVFSIAAAAQAPQRAPAAAKPAAKPAGSLAQVMRGIFFPNSNIIFEVQQNDPAAPKKKSDAGASATDSYAGVYSGWEMVENAAVAVTDGVDLIMTPGRLCQNGKPVPTRNADFQRFAQNMRKAGLAVLQAAHTKNQEKVSDATNDLADACSACHEIYRDKGPADSAARCIAPPK
jgi:cytochrome c556